MEGGPLSGDGADAVGDSCGRPPRSPRPARPWRWALGGAAVVSLGWAVALYAYGPWHGTGPDTRGYRLSQDLCGDARLRALSGELGSRSDDAHWSGRDPALDRASCSVRLTPESERSASDQGTKAMSYGVRITAAVHHRTDPGPEFRAAGAMPDWFSEDGSPARVEGVPGLGDEAYLTTFGDGANTVPRLEVRDGSAEFTLQLTASYDYQDRGGPGRPADDPSAADMEALQPGMIADMRALMERLKH